MSDLRARLADALERELDEHDYEDDDEKRGQVAHHFADVLLSLPGVAIVELPEPEEHTEMDELGPRCWHFPHDISGWNGEFPGVMDCDADMSPWIARSIAASLLAAANAAEHEEVVQ